MRIDDSNSLQYDKLPGLKRAQEKQDKSAQSPSVEQGELFSTEAAGESASSVQSRANRVEQLKQAYSQGNPVDVGKLADKLIQTGIFFDEKV